MKFGMHFFEFDKFGEECVVLGIGERRLDGCCHVILVVSLANAGAEFLHSIFDA